MVVGAVVVVDGCSLFTNLDEFASEDPPGAIAEGGADGPTPIADAGSDLSSVVDADSRDDGEKQPVNVHPSPDFELSGCNGWGSYHGTLTPSSTAHSGTGACRVCTDGSNSDFTADDNGVIASTIGVTYRAEAWVRADPQKPPPPYMGMTLRTRNDGPFAEVETAYASLGGAPNGTWQKLTTSLTVSKNAQKVNIVVGGGFAQNACFLLDDVALYKID